MTLGELIKAVDVMGQVHLSVMNGKGEEVERKTIGWTDALHESDQYYSYGEWSYVSDYEDLAVNAIYCNDNGVTIEMIADE